jgi:hypothetical protein
MPHNGKIGRLPVQIREQLNRRIENGEIAKTLVPWLNSLPETIALMKACFGGALITQQNISEWTRGGFIDWQAQEAALEFVANLKAESAAAPNLTGDNLAADLAHWLSLRYATAAHAIALAHHEDPESQLRHLSAFCQDLSTLRRGELSAARLHLQKQRLDQLLALTQEQKEIEFWEWTKRPDIQAKLYPHRDPDKMRRDVERLVNRTFLGIREPDDASQEESDCPAILI